MNEPSLWVVSAAGFTAVMMLLAILAGIIRILVAAFPERTVGVEAEVVAAISATVAASHPGAKVTAVEEIR